MFALLQGARAAVFDAVGTLIVPNPPAPVVYAETAARFGFHFSNDEIASRFHDAFRIEEALDRVAGWRTSEERERERWRRIVRYSLPGTPEECFERLFDHFAHPESWRVPKEVPGVLAAIELRLGIATNFDRRLVSVLAGRPELAPVFEHVVISSVVGIRKPHRDFFLAVAQNVKARPEEIVFVGDELANDFEGASAAGLRAILLDPAGRHAQIAPRIASLEELLS